MTRSLREYIKEKFIENSYMETILKKTSPTIDMFIDVGESFGFGETKKSSSSSFYGWEVGDYYFYPMDFNGKNVRMAYVDYSDKLKASIYTDEMGNLFTFNYTTHKGSPTDMSSIAMESKRDKHKEYIAKLEKKETETKVDEPKLIYLFIGDAPDKKYFHGSDENFYVSIKNASKIKLESNTEEFLFCKGVWTNLQKLA